MGLILILQTMSQRLINYINKEVPEYRGLFFVEGVEDNINTDPYPHWWGGNLRDAKDYPIKTGDASLDQRVVFSPHIYGQEVYPHPYVRKPFDDNLQP